MRSSRLFVKKPNKQRNKQTQKTVRYTPNFQEVFYLQTDASGSALGAVLFQRVQGEERSIAYASKQFSRAEVRYFTTERECLAIRWGVEIFRYYLLGRTFILITDHAPLRWLQSAKTDKACIIHWSLALQPFCFSVEHQPRNKNMIADFLCHSIPAE